MALWMLEPLITPIQVTAIGSFLYFDLTFSFSFYILEIVFMNKQKY